MGQQPSTPQITEQDRAIFQLKQQRDKLKQYQRKLAVVIERQQALAKQALAKKDTDRAKFYLRSKKQQQSVIAKTYEQLDNLEKLIGTIEFKLIEKDVIYGLEQGNQVLSKLNSEMSVDKIDQVLDDLEDEKLKVDQVAAMLGNSLSNSEELEVDAEFEALQKEVEGTKEAKGTQKEALPEVPTNKPIKLPEAPTDEPAANNNDKETNRPQLLA